MSAPLALDLTFGDPPLRRPALYACAPLVTVWNFHSLDSFFWCAASRCSGRFGS